MKKKRLWITGVLVSAILGLYHLTLAHAGAAGSGDGWLTDWYVYLLIFGLLGALVTGILFFEKVRGREISLTLVYPAAGMFLGLMYMFALPPLSAPDEVSHYISACQLSSRMLGRPSNSADGHVLVRARDWFIEDVYGDYSVSETEPYLVKGTEDEDDSRAATLLGQVLEERTYRAIHDMISGAEEMPWQDEPEDRLAVSPYPPVVTTPLAYVPQALGISLARILNLNSLWLLYMGRFFNLVFFTAMTWLAMRRLPFGREVLFGTSILPMTLNLAASFSYDVMIMACMFLFTAVCVDLAYNKAAAEWKDILLLAVLMAVAGPCKMVYSAMMGLCLLIPVRKFGGWGRWLLSAALVASAWLAAMVLVNGQVVAGYAAATDPLVSGGTEAGFSLTLLLHRPGLLLQIFYNTLVHMADEYHLTMIGYQLGNLDPVLSVPYAVTILLSGCLLLLAFRKPGENLYINGGRRFWIFAVCLGCGAALMLSMLISCTPLSSTVVQGVQGRYFLPLLPAFLMAVKNDRLVLTKDGNRSILYVMYCADLYVVLRLFGVVCTRL